MPVSRSRKHRSAGRLAAVARKLLGDSTLCAIATVAPRGRAYVNTAYFAFSDDLDIVWWSSPDATHSRNIRATGSAAVAVYRSTQTWGNPDRGIQLFGTARQVAGSAADDAEQLYAARFPGYHQAELSAPYGLYVLRPQRIKLFDEREFGTAVFVTARVERGGRLAWQRTEVYRQDTNVR